MSHVVAEEESAPQTVKILETPAQSGGLLSLKHREVEREVDKRMEKWMSDHDLSFSTMTSEQIVDLRDRIRDELRQEVDNA